MSVHVAKGLPFCGAGPARAQRKRRIGLLFRLAGMARRPLRSMHLGRLGVKTRPADRTCRVAFIRRERFPPSSHPTASPIPSSSRSSQLALFSTPRGKRLLSSRAHQFLEAREGAALSGRAGTARLHRGTNTYKAAGATRGMRTSARSVRPVAAAAEAAA